MIKRSEFEIRAEQDGDEGGARVVVAGDLDIATVPELEAALDRLLGDGVRRLSIDLRGLTFADSSGVRLLIAVGEQADAGGWTLQIVRPPDEAFIFRISGADAALPFVEG